MNFQNKYDLTVNDKDKNIEELKSIISKNKTLTFEGKMILMPEIRGIKVI